MKKKDELEILVDLDGVLADFEGRRFKVLQDRGLPAVPPAEVHDFYANEAYESRFGVEARRAARAVTTELGFFRSMRPVEGAIEGVNRLVDMGHNVRICSKPLEEHPRCTEEKLEWVLEHLGKWWADRAIIAKRKSEYEADAPIDDRPDLVHYTRRRREPEPTWQHVLFCQPWNESSSMHDYHMRDWTDFDWVERALERRSTR